MGCEACGSGAQEAEKRVKNAEYGAAEGDGADINRRTQVSHQNHVDQTQQRNSYVADNVWDG